MEWKSHFRNPRLLLTDSSVDVDRCLGCRTIDGDRLTRNRMLYYVMRAFASKFGSWFDPDRISGEVEGLHKCGFQRPDGIWFFV